MEKNQLEDIIRKANESYWINNNPIISDVEYDRLVEELKQLDPNNPLITHIGGVKGKYRHSIPMLSLDKAYSEEDIVKWAYSVSRNADEMIAVQPKYDGLACKIEKDRITTRGDGYIGEDITSHKDLIGFEHIINTEGSPDCLVRKYPFKTYINLIEVEQPVYGELLIDYETFNKYFVSGKILRQDGMKYSNPRNAVAGLFNLKDISSLPKGLVTFVPYKNHSILLRRDRLSSIFFSVIKTLKEEFLPKYPIDGVVFKLYDKKYFDSLGSTAHHPRGAIAFKFVNSSNYGVVDKVVWQLGKEVITPVLILKGTCEINGSRISRVTCHNYKFFKDLNLKEGQVVLIEKAGDIIPKIVSVLEDSNGKELKAPTKCPCCGSDLVEVSVDLVCPNDDCKGKIIPKLVYATKVLNLYGFGPSIISDIVTKLHVRYLYQLLETNYWYSISHFPGYTEYSADLLAVELQLAVGTVTEAQLLASLCIPGIGLELSKKICEQFSYEDLFCTNKIMLSELDNIVGPTRGQWIRDFYSKHSLLFKQSYMYFKPIKQIKVSYEKDKVCFTGKFDLSRSECQKLVEDNDMIFTDSMSKDVSYLVVSDMNTTSSKMQYAKKNNIKILTFDEFKSLLSNKGSV